MITAKSDKKLLQEMSFILKKVCLIERKEGEVTDKAPQKP